MEEGGSSTAGAHAATHDAEDRPIAARGFVKSGPVAYQDISRPSGLASWAHFTNDHWEFGVVAASAITTTAKIDVAVNPLEVHAILLRDRNPGHNHWVELKLIGGPKCPRGAIGATVYLPTIHRIFIAQDKGITGALCNAKKR